MQTPSEERLVALLDQWSLQWTWRGRQRAIGAGAYERYCTLGLYAFGGNAPNVSKASSMKEACIAVNRFMRHRFPHGTWTSIAVLLNPRIGLHRDMQNMVGKLNHAITLGTFNGGRESGLKTKKELQSKLLPKTAKFVSSKEHGSTFMTNLCLSTRDGFIKLSHMKVICVALAAYTPQSFERCSDEVRSKLRNLSFRVLIKFVDIQNKISLPYKHKYFVHSLSAMQ